MKRRRSSPMMNRPAFPAAVTAGRDLPTHAGRSLGLGLRSVWPTRFPLRPPSSPFRADCLHTALASLPSGPRPQMTRKGQEHRADGNESWIFVFTTWAILWVSRYYYPFTYILLNTSPLDVLSLLPHPHISTFSGLSCN